MTLRDITYDVFNDSEALFILTLIRSKMYTNFIVITFKRGFFLLFTSYIFFSGNESPTSNFVPYKFRQIPSKTKQKNNLFRQEHDNISESRCTTVVVTGLDV